MLKRHLLTKSNIFYSLLRLESYMAAWLFLAMILALALVLLALVKEKARG
ncbi:hypothetical protein [Neomoorella glycerini]|nr:hypothetical protein [Moorella glycerini]